MSVRPGARRGLWAAAVLALAGVTALAVVGVAGAKRSASCGTVTLNEQAWAGSTANTYVAKNVLESIGLQGQHHPDHGDPRLPGDGRRQGRRGARGLAAHRPVQAVRHQAEDGLAHRPERGHGRDRLVHPRLPDEAVPAVQDLEGAEGQGGHLQEPGVRLAGDVPRRRPLLRPEGQGADPGARAELQVRQRRRGAGPGRTVEPALQAAQAGDLLLVRPAVPERDLQAGPGPAAAALQGLQGRREGRRRPEGVCLRLSVVRAREALQQEVRHERLARRRRAEAVEVDERGPERRRQADRRESREPRQGGADVDQGQPAKVKAWLGK